MASPTSDGEEDEEVWGQRVAETHQSCGAGFLKLIIDFLEGSERIWPNYTFQSEFALTVWGLGWCNLSWFLGRFLVPGAHFFKNDATAASGVFCKVTAAVEARVPLESAGTVKLPAMKGWTDVSMFLWFNHYQEFGKPPGGQQCWETCYKWFINSSQWLMRHIWETWKVERFKVRFGWHSPFASG